MTTADQLTGAYAWLASSVTRRASDALLGGVLLIAGVVAIWDSRSIALKQWPRLGAEFFPFFIGAAVIAVVVLLVGRAAFIRRQQPAPWRLWGIALVVAAVAVVEANLWWRPTWLLHFGPPEYVALITLIFVAAIAAARWSRLRAVGMTLLGLLLSAVGIDGVTGQFRLTMGFELLTDGMSAYLVVLGLIIVADGLVCMVSPSLWLATFGWVRAPHRESNLPAVASIALRAVAILAIAAAGYLAFDLNAQTWDIGLVLVLGLFGIACMLFGWNRPVLILACVYGATLEQSIRQSMVLSNGDPAIFFQRPISGALLACSIAVVVLVVLLVARRSFWTSQFPAGR